LRTGVPSTALLAERFDVTGVDISRAQLEIARINVPKANFIEADLASVDFPDGNFNAVTAFYSLIHLPRTELPGLFERLSDGCDLTGSSWPPLLHPTAPTGPATGWASQCFSAATTLKPTAD
jgi:trans-aconitate methyltransferase